MNTLEKLQLHLSAPEIAMGGTDYFHKPLADLVVCADDSVMSVQASQYHYSEPRENTGPYTHVEVWRCGSPEAWAEYGDGEEPYAYIPIELVAEEIDRRGGFKVVEP